ncbi:membrane hypothetical protein [Candidatus Sulfotelmatomonas gaucii]|uniref:Uncharacterized protein n=1 Tax=Candidatus Sulfuritelmatomonas gaucii TaxID=2043161 RepID=A0A2N9LB17_9BACT|nr:membrane hypothetical protein [Candidatus Sulfotelmatomonas gaucii]
MQDEMSRQDLNERLAVIERMIVEGRIRSESWGWTFLLWGVAYYVAIAWATWGQSLAVWSSTYSRWYAWPVTMMAALVLTLAIGMRRGHGEPGTTVIRAIVSVWICAGISMMFLFPAMSFAGTPVNQHSFVAIVAAMMGVTNGASGLILRWKMQVACAVVWWITAAAACFGSDAQLAVVFLTAIFLCQIAFGIYAMVLESRRRAQHGVAHA